MIGSKRIVWGAILTIMAGMTAHGVDIIDFSGLQLNSNSYWNGSDKSGGFNTGGVFFSNAYDYFPDYEMEYWTGWSYSNVTSTVPGFQNQYASITGGGIGGAGTTYGIAYVDSPDGAYINLGVQQALAMTVTNTAYAYHAMKSGDQFSSAFGPNDWFELTIRGFNDTKAKGGTTGSITIRLASGTNILDQWVSIDLTSISAGAKSFGFDLTSSDSSPWGMNTPAYFALGSLTVAPEPGSVILAFIAGLTLLAIRRKKS